MLVDITPEEFEQVLFKRRQIEEYKNRQMAQGLCQHHWNFEGRSHKDDFYTCGNCGAFKFD